MEPKLVTTVEELRDEIDAVAKIAASGDPDWAKHLGSFDFRPPIDHWKAMDPCSPAYFDQQYQLYENLTGRTYEVSNELHGKDSFPGVYPFFTGNLNEIGTHLMRVANVIRCLPLKPGAKVLELGAGWGNLSVLMAQSGLQVTTIDIEPRFKQIIEERAAAAGVQITARCEDFASLANDTETYDCGLFSESFHHARNHIELFHPVEQRVSADGLLVWASEPIWEHLSLPWSLRSDSLSLYCIRRFGWFETGFTESYLLDLLLRAGWTCVRSEIADPTSSTVFVGRRAKGIYKPGEMALPPSQAATWHGPEVAHRWTKAESIIRLPEVNGTVTVQMQTHSARPRTVHLSIGKNRKSFSVKPAKKEYLSIPCDPSDSLMRITCEPWRPSDRGSPDDRVLGVAVEQITVA